MASSALEKAVQGGSGVPTQPVQKTSNRPLLLTVLGLMALGATLIYLDIKLGNRHKMRSALDQFGIMQLWNWDQRQYRVFTGGDGSYRYFFKVHGDLPKIRGFIASISKSRMLPMRRYTPAKTLLLRPETRDDPEAENNRFEFLSFSAPSGWFESSSMQNGERFLLTEAGFDSTMIIDEDLGVIYIVGSHFDGDIPDSSSEYFF